MSIQKVLISYRNFSCNKLPSTAIKLTDVPRTLSPQKNWRMSQPSWHVSLFSTCGYPNDGFFFQTWVCLSFLFLNSRHPRTLPKLFLWKSLVLYLLCGTPGEITVIWRFFIRCRVMVWGCSCFFSELSKSERNCRHRVEFCKSRSLVPEETHISCIGLFKLTVSFQSSISVLSGSNSLCVSATVCPWNTLL